MHESTLSKRAQQIIACIDDAPLRERVQTTLTLANDAWVAWATVHLPLDDFEVSRPLRAEAKNVELIPYVLKATEAVTDVLRHWAETFPASVSLQGTTPTDDDIDLAFDLTDSPDTPKHGVAFKRLSPEADFQERMHAFGGMLQMRVVQLGERLERALAEDDGWALLVALDDQKHRIMKALQAILFGGLECFANDVRREEIVPNYRSAVGESIALRQTLTELGYHVKRFNEALNDAAAHEVLPLLVGIASRLDGFTKRCEYRSLRADDKRAVIEFCTELHDMRRERETVLVTKIRQAVEGFAKFLETLHAINHREVLVVFDRQRLQEALSEVEHPHEPVTFERLHTLLTPVKGRNAALDAALRQVAEGTQVFVAERFRDLIKSALDDVR